MTAVLIAEGVADVGIHDGVDPDRKLKVNADGSIDVNTELTADIDVSGLAQEDTLAGLAARADLLATEATLATRASEATLSALKSRADLLASETTLGTRGTEATLATRASEATLVALKTRSDLLATEATLATRSTEATVAALKARADLLATEATVAARLDVALSTRAQQTTLQLVLDKLVDIFAAVDGLEVTAGNIEISASTINLQTDEVEALLQSVRDRLPALLDADGGLKAHVQNFPASQAVTGPLTDAQLRAAPVPVSGTVTANLGTIDGAATEVTLGSILTELSQKLEPGQQVALDAPTLAALETINAIVSGTVAVSNFPASVEVSNDAGNPLPVSGTVAVTQPVAVTDNGGSLTVDGFVSVSNMVAQGLTDTQLRAAAVPVSLPALADALFTQFAVTVGQVALGSFASRATVSVKALAANGDTVYVGETGVTTSTGWELSPGDSIDIDLQDGTTLFAVSATGTQRVCVAQVA